MKADNQHLLDFMNTYWLPNRGSAEHFWQHEWSKHGTCINTLSPSCYGDGYTAGQEVVDFFTRTIDLFKVISILSLTCIFYNSWSIENGRMLTLTIQ